MLTFSEYFVLVINGNQINGFHLFWDTLYLPSSFAQTVLCIGDSVFFSN